MDKYIQNHLDGRLHNPNGIARKSRDMYGQIEREQYNINGKELTKEQFEKINTPCDGKTIEIEGKKYKLTAI